MVVESAGNSQCRMFFCAERHGGRECRHYEEKLQDCFLWIQVSAAGDKADLIRFLGMELEALICPRRASLQTRVSSVRSRRAPEYHVTGSAYRISCDELLNVDASLALIIKYVSLVPYLKNFLFGVLELSHNWLHCMEASKETVTSSAASRFKA
jgi:hypothetical protein